MIALQPAFIVLTVLVFLKHGFVIGFVMTMFVIVIATTAITFIILISTKEERKERIRLRLWRRGNYHDTTK